MHNADDGFSLVELLVVMVIVGILTAIAIPVLLAQRAAAVDRSMVSDLKNIAFEQENHYLKTGDYLASADVAGESALAARLSAGNQGIVTLNPGGRQDTFCVRVIRRNGASASRSPARVYVSDRGGVAELGVVNCF